MENKRCSKPPTSYGCQKNIGQNSVYPHWSHLDVIDVITKTIGQHPWMSLDSYWKKNTKLHKYHSRQPPLHVRRNSPLNHRESERVDSVVPCSALHSAWIWSQGPRYSANPWRRRRCQWGKWWCPGATRRRCRSWPQLSSWWMAFQTPGRWPNVQIKRSWCSSNSS